MFFKLSVIFVVATVVQCRPYGQASYGHSSYMQHSVGLPIHSRHQISHYDVHSSGYSHPTNVEVGPSHTPINVRFHTQSSPVKVSQSHHSAPGSHHESHSQDEPHKLVHTVTKPIYQEVREIVMPRRKIIQEVKPVQEEIETHVARHAGHSYGHQQSHGYGQQQSHSYSPKMESHGHKAEKYGQKEESYGQKAENYGHKEMGHY